MVLVRAPLPLLYVPEYSKGMGVEVLVGYVHSAMRARQVASQIVSQ